MSQQIALLHWQLFLRGRMWRRQLSHHGGARTPGSRGEKRHLATLRETRQSAKIFYNLLKSFTICYNLLKSATICCNLSTDQSAQRNATQRNHTPPRDNPATPHEMQPQPATRCASDHTRNAATDSHALLQRPRTKCSHSQPDPKETAPLKTHPRKHPRNR